MKKKQVLPSWSLGNQYGLLILFMLIKYFDLIDENILPQYLLGYESFFELLNHFLS